LRAFSLVWLGQVISLVGTRMSFFAILIWVWDQTGSATAMITVNVVASIPALLVRFIAGSLVDRWNRKRVMQIADVIAGFASLTVFVLFTSGQLEIWHLYVTAAIAGMAGTFQGLAYSASLSLMIPKAHYARARGLISLGDYASQVGAPLLGGLLVAIIGISGVLLLDLLTLLVAMVMLAIVHIPQPVSTPTAQRPALLHDALLGYQFILKRRGLFGLLLITLAFAFCESLAFPLIAPMILARTGGDEITLGTVMAVQGASGIIGSLVLVAWGGPKRRIHGVLLGVILTGLLGDTLMGFGQSLPVWLLAALGLEFFIPMMMGSYHAIWQSKVEPSMQGRVFAARDVVASFGEPIAKLGSGIMADTVFGPAMMPGGSLAPILGPLIGTGPGAGIGLVIILGGLMTTAAGLLGYFVRNVRNLETQIPDAVQVTEPVATVPER
jgi:MFS family permease